MTPYVLLIVLLCSGFSNQQLSLTKDKQKALRQIGHSFGRCSCAKGDCDYPISATNEIWQTRDACGRTIYLNPHPWSYEYKCKNGKWVLIEIRCITHNVSIEDE